jgi:hypothetical protein
MARLYFKIPASASCDRGEQTALPMIALDIDAPETPDVPKHKTRLTTPSWTPTMAAKSSA